MSSKINKPLTACGIVLLSIFGCATNRPGPSQAGKQGETIRLRCQYQPGFAETLRYSNEHVYKNWVEMPQKPANPTGQRTTQIMMVLRREVESVGPDGSAIMKVTIQDAQMTLNVETQRKNKQDNYHSAASGTESTWQGAPALAGVSYRIKIAPDTTVVEFMDLDQVRKDLKITDQGSNPVGMLLSEEGIRKVHQRDFVMAAPAEAVKTGQKYDKLFPLPDRMIKAQAIKKNFQVEEAKTAGDTRVAVVEITGEAAHTVPKDFPISPKPVDMHSTIIKNASDMQELKISGQGRFDAKAGRVLGESNTIDCLLALFEESIMQKKDDTGDKSEKADKPEGNGVMFTKITIDQKIEVTP
jgi:hypothetical protein